jgi:hypothetical protein
MKRIGILILMTAVVLAGALFAQGQEKKAGLVQEIVKLNYVQPQDIIRLLGPLTGREGRITFAPNEKFLSLSDSPENIAKLLAAIKEIDVKPADVLFTVQLVLASEDGTPKTDVSLANDPVIKELKGFLKYKSFSLLDTSLVRGTSRHESILTMGPNGNYVLELMPNTITADKSQTVEVFVRLKQILGSSGDKVTSQPLIESSLTMKSGDKTVVGVSRTAGGDKGLILIIEAKVVA